MTETVPTRPGSGRRPPPSGAPGRTARVSLVRTLVCTLALAVATTVSAAPSMSATAVRTGVPTATTSSAQPLTTTKTTTGIWRKLPASPLPAMQITTGVWTGRDMLVYGVRFSDSGAIRATAAAYRPSTRTWRMLPAPPARASVEGREQAVWTGREMLVWGASASSAYNVSTRTWRELPDLPDGVASAGPGGHVMVWTGKQMIIWGGGCCGDAVNTGAAYTPATNSWRGLPRSPLSGRSTTGAWTGKELVLAGGTGPEGQLLRSAAAYNPLTRHWRTLPRPPWAVAADTAIWDGSEVLLTGGYGRAGYESPLRHGLAYKPATNRWRALPAATYPRVESVAVWTGKRLLVWGGLVAGKSGLIHAPHGESFNPRTGHWAPIAKSPLRGGRYGPVTVWTGKQMIIWGGVTLRDDPTLTFRDGAAYTP